MVFVLSFVLYYVSMSHILASAKDCDPANHICSGRCPNIPPEVVLPSGVAICLKDSKTQACVCWLRSDTSHSNNLFLCEALINGSVSQILCNTPRQCFPPDTEPTCLVIPFCNCVLMKDDDSSSALQFGDWKPVKAIIKSTQNSDKYPDQVQEFSLKHLLFLIGFVIAPLLCWCFLNFVTEKKCRRKNTNCPETQPINIDRSVIDQNSSHIADYAAPIISTNNADVPPSVQSSVNVTNRQDESDCLSHPLSDASRFVEKNVNPPSYEEVIHGSVAFEDNSPPPPYESTVCEQGNSMCQMWQSVFHTQSRSSDIA